MVLDFGGQYAHLICRRIRDLGVYAEILPSDARVEQLQGAKGIILSGGPSSVYEKNAPRYDERLFTIKIPILGLCYGQQLMAQQLGGKVVPGKIKEYGIATLQVKKAAEIFAGLEEKETVWMSHGDAVEKLPAGFELYGFTRDCKIAAMGNGEYFGLQFHPEVTHTVNGNKILENFVFQICQCQQDWDMHRFYEQREQEIKQKVGNKNVFLLVSGGVDSAVCFALLTKVLGKERVYGLHIDNGFMRKNESSMVKEAMQHFGSLHVVDKSEGFITALKGVTDPELKRNIIGKVFLDIANTVIQEVHLDPDNWIIAQGTIYPDVIEAKGSRNADLIKTHHNRIQAMQELIEQGKVIEPIHQLYKDEVRLLGMELGLPLALIQRHPFPGPGLAVRCLCSNGKAERIKGKKEAEARIQKILDQHDLKGVVLPIQSVGVQGDARTYRHPIAITGKAEWDMLENISTSLTNKFREINRVIYVLAAKKHVKGLKLKESYVTKERLDTLREEDAIAMESIEKAGLMEDIWQMPTILLPLSFDGKGESIVLRPVYSREAMTAAFAKIPMDVAKEIAEKMMALPGIDAVFYDVTNKPPGTIEWE